MTFTSSTILTSRNLLKKDAFMYVAKIKNGVRYSDGEKCGCGGQCQCGGSCGCGK